MKQGGQVKQANPYERYQVNPEQAGLTVEAYLKGILKISGRRIQKLTRLKGILLNGKAVFLQRKVKSGDVLSLRVLGDLDYGVLPEPGEVEILFEDADLIILNKPTNLLVHPTGRTFHGTLSNFLAYYFKERGEIITIRPLHRLDRDTSGCVVFAKSARTQSLLEEQIKDGKLKRIYLALIVGVLEPAEGTIEAPIGPHPTLPNRRMVDAQGEPAITRYRTLRRFGSGVLLELSLETGRTHQIRVHLSHLGHPVIGDRMYGKHSPLITRQALHAVSVNFVHPRDGRRLEIAAPLPEDWQRLIASAV